MPPVLHQHPFASFCQKALIAFYELDVPFETVLVEGREEHLKLWPLGTIPVLVDGELVLPESTSIIEHIDDGRLTADPEARLWDRLADNHLDRPMQKIVTNYLRPTDSPDPYGVEEARAQLGRGLRRVRRAPERPGLARGRRLHGRRLRGRAGALLLPRRPSVGRPRGAVAVLPRDARATVGLARGGGGAAVPPDLPARLRRRLRRLKTGDAAPPGRRTSRYRQTRRKT